MQAFRLSQGFPGFSKALISGFLGARGKPEMPETVILIGFRLSRLSRLFQARALRVYYVNRFQAFQTFQTFQTFQALQASHARQTLQALQAFQTSQAFQAFQASPSLHGKGIILIGFRLSQAGFEKA